nr:S8 family serine peptidase [Hankyongella ginsenosidimutans]
MAKLLLAVAASAGLSACGGSSGGSPTAPAVTPSAPATPPPAPPPPASAFDTAEYQRSSSLAVVQPIPAYEAGATGDNVTIGIVDSGIDLNNSEFTGRIAAASRDVFGNRTLQDPDGHGTLVAAIAAAPATTLPPMASHSTPTCSSRAPTTTSPAPTTAAPIWTTTSLTASTLRPRLAPASSTCRWAVRRPTPA